MTELVFLVEDSPEGGFTARALGHSIHTEADTYAELRDNVRDAVQCHFEAGERPKLFRLRQYKVSGPLSPPLAEPPTHNALRHITPSVMVTP